jgi:HlyD family secretion protein
MKRLFRRGIIVLVVLGFVSGAALWYIRRGNSQETSFRTAPVKRGDLVVSIGATGTVEPEEVVDVGAQVAGRIVSFGKDADGKTVDYGSPVKEGTVLAQIDDSLYTADEAQAEAQVQSAKAGVRRAEADLEQMKAKFRAAERDWLRAKKLGPSEALAQTSYDAYQSAYETAKANVMVGEAAILQARAAVAQAQAGLQRAQRNLGYCTITAPVKGVIIDRRVNIGQTVVASLNAPSLFLIAKDLRRMQVWVAVNEADIASIHPEQPVTFTVDAFPGETFEGKVGKVRLNASMTQNVVTYTVEITTDNSSGRLLPYLTADVQFELSRSSNVLLVPNEALRWRPPAEQIAPAAEKRSSEDSRQQVAGPGLRNGDGRGHGVVWVVNGGHVRPVRVRLELTDGTVTEVAGDGLTEGMEVVTGTQTETDRQTGTRNPFAPQFRRGGRSSSRSR